MSNELDAIQVELGEHGAAWRKVYNAHLRDPKALAGVASANGCFGAVQYALELRAGGKDSFRDGAVLNNLHRLAAAIAAPIEPVVETLRDVTDRPLFTGIPENIKQ